MKLKFHNIISLFIRDNYKNTNFTKDGESVRHSLFKISVCLKR